MTRARRWGRLGMLFVLFGMPACLLEQLDRSRLDAGRDDAGPDLDGDHDMPDAVGSDGDEDVPDDGGSDGEGDGEVVETCGNGRRDPGETCERGDFTTCTTMCGETGATQVCQDDCVYGPCLLPTAETCNGRDDDGDTRTDECVWCQGAPSGYGGLYAVALDDDGTVWAAGEAGSPGSGVPEMLRRDPTTGDWAREGMGLAGRLEALTFVAGELFTAGTSGQVYKLGAADWETFGTAVGTGTLHGLFGTDPAHLWAVGDALVGTSTAVVRQWNGTDWLPFASPAADGVDFFAIDGNASSGDILAVGSEGAVFRHLPGTRTTIDGSPSLHGIHFRSNADIWVVGDVAGRGMVYRWTGGADWSEVWTPPGPPFTDVWASADGNHAFVVRDLDAEILHWNSSLGWERLFGPHEGHALHGIAGDDATGDVWAVGSEVLHWDG